MSGDASVPLGPAASPRLLLDATAVPADRGGVGRYVDALVPALVAAGARLVVACQERDAALLAGLAPAAEVVTAPGPAARVPVRLAWEQAGLPALARRTGAQVLLSPHYTMPVRAPLPVVVTLHDATFFSHPELHSPVKARFFRAATRLAVRRAGALVVPSAATRDEVLRHVGGPGARAERFHVAHHGVDRTVFHPADEDAQRRLRERLGLGTRPYVAFLGTLEPRKNVPALVRAWARVAATHPDRPALVLAGGPGWDGDVEPAIAAVPPGLTVLRTGYLPLPELAPLLSGAAVVAYPSLGEGFGLPVLEAMACGATVLTTRELSLPEVGGDAVAYCGTDEASVAQGLAALLDDAAAPARLRAAARQRAALFTWDAAARVHLAAASAALAGG
ncbi:glycosyltransferase family 4 protein [Cellulomonas marina]|uniref:Glycosyltransferase involved in cell wall bisynthesis n=1 Tax=Cellulomonas marina TaxID=988821 RepID=A0A1I0UZ36_9CELL|nr:glycosyltransferase family 1 protein [Cellulomonas marina]GIG29904.1 glycosyl transferase [Cellulomonas marina]SFA69315.1 Glycosyltransferase involved in cell wall bisynthesis [Cellulomonas marina]